MNQSNQSLQVSKNDSFSEQNQPSQQHTDNYNQIAPRDASRPYDVKVFAVGTKDKILSESYALEEHADQWVMEFGPDFRQTLFLYPSTYFFGSEFARDRQKLLAIVIGATRGTYFVINGGDDLIVKNRLISPVLQSLEQATAWRHLSLPYYPDCQIVHYDHGLEGDGPDFQNEYDFLAGNHITAYAVVYGGDGERQCLPIGDRYFITEAQARCYQAEILSEYPACQISQQNFHYDDVRQRQKGLESLFGHLKAENADSAVEV